MVELLLPPHIYPPPPPHTLISLPLLFVSDFLVQRIHHKSNTTTNSAIYKGDAILMHHQMAFDSAGLVASAQNRLGEAPWSGLDAGKEHERALGCDAHQRHAGRKKKKTLAS